MREVRISPDEAGQRLDKFLRKYLREAGSGFLYKMLRKKNITLNGGRAEGSERLEAGDLVRFFLAEETLEKFRGSLPATAQDAWEKQGKASEKGRGPADRRTVPEPVVIYEGAHVLLVNKPAGMLTQKAKPEDYSLNEWLLDYLTGSGGITAEELRAFRPSVCNRLDRNTGGLVVCGRTLAGSQEMSRLIREGRLRKFYRLLVIGEMTGEGTLESWLAKDPVSNQVRLWPADPGRPDAARIRTGYRVLASSGGLSYVEARLFTGKTHQIRAQFASLGHPLVGDMKYGNKEANDRFRPSGVRSQLLHAFRLEFPSLDGAFAELSQRSFIAPEPEIFDRIRKLTGLTDGGFAWKDLRKT